jgi:hypothetical protein
VIVLYELPPTAQQLYQFLHLRGPSEATGPLVHRPPIDIKIQWGIPQGIAKSYPEREYMGICPQQNYKILTTETIHNHGW